jgi:hypothetical protein
MKLGKKNQDSLGGQVVEFIRLVKVGIIKKVRPINIPVMR